MKHVILRGILMCVIGGYAQVPFTFISPAVNSAERVSKFGVSDVDSDFLEITNSTQFNNSFIPSIWAHQQSDNRFVLRHFATTNSSRDNGNIPMMIFRAEIRNQINVNAPSGDVFPWGSSSSNVLNRPLFAWENGNDQLMRILANGFIGIGTINPTALLHTNGTVRFQNLPDATLPFKILGTDSNGNVLEYSPAELSVGGTSDFDWLKSDGSVPTSIEDHIYTLGNVGINVINPTANLNVRGTVRFEDLPETSQPFKILGVDSSGNVSNFLPTALSVVGSNDADWLKPDDTISTSIDDNIYTRGKVGIHTSAFPSQVGNANVNNYRLFVKGGILTEEVRVSISSEWADFVFDDDYKLDSLPEIEAFIKSNKHLKGIPSAEDVKSDGIELGEMNKLLLQKVEELTLHLIEMDKKIQSLINEINSIKSNE